jgi:hypothetical protein
VSPLGYRPSRWWTDGSFEVLDLWLHLPTDSATMAVARELYSRTQTDNLRQNVSM